MLVRKIISPVLVVLYMFAVNGFVFHNCHCKQSQYISILTTGNFSECHHHKQQKKQKPCCKSENKAKKVCAKDDNTCCELTHKSIKTDQENFVQQIKTSIKLPVLYALSKLSSYNDSFEIHDSNKYFEYSKPPSENLKTSLIYHNCQLRL